MVLLQLERNLEYVRSKELITKAEAEAEEKKWEKGKETTVIATGAWQSSLLP